MAKNTRSGLGRGLNSLLGGSFDEPTPIAPSSARERIVVDAEDIPAYTPPKEAPRASEVQAAPIPALEEVSYREEVVRPAKTELSIREIIEKKLDEVPIDHIAPNPDQPRTNFKPEEIEELASSIEKDGLLQPILVRTVGENEYQIIAGERRWQACKSLGMEKVPIRINDVDENRALELALVENIQRSNLNPIEEAYGYRRLIERSNMTQADIAQAVSKGRSTIANALRLLELPEEAQQLLYEEKITAGHARAILSIPTKEGRQSLTNKLIETKMSVREAESLARLLAGKSNEAPKKREPLPATYKSVAKTLRDVLKTNVRVKSSKGKNKIEIEFKDEEDLERVFSEIIKSES